MLDARGGQGRAEGVGLLPHLDLGRRGRVDEVGRVLGRAGRAVAAGHPHGGAPQPCGSAQRIGGGPGVRVGDRVPQWSGGQRVVAGADLLRLEHRVGGRLPRRIAEVDRPGEHSRAVRTPREALGDVGRRQASPAVAGDRPMRAVGPGAPPLVDPVDQGAADQRRVVAVAVHPVDRQARDRTHPGHHDDRLLARRACCAVGEQAAVLDPAVLVTLGTVQQVEDGVPPPAGGIPARQHDGDSHTVDDGAPEARMRWGVRLPARLRADRVERCLERRARLRGRERHRRHQQGDHEAEQSGGHDRSTLTGPAGYGLDAELQRLFDAMPRAVLIGQAKSPSPARDPDGSSVATPQGLTSKSHHDHRRRVSCSLSG